MLRPLAHLSCALLALTFYTNTACASDNETQSNAVRYDTLEVSKMGDLEKSCNALSKEALNMHSAIHAMQEIKNASKMQSNGITAAGAVGSFLIGSVTGGIGLAVGGMLLDYNVDENADAADDIQDTAKQRRTLMTGIFNAKGCYGPIEHVMIDPKERKTTLERIATSDGPVYQAELRSRYNN